MKRHFSHSDVQYYAMDGKHLTFVGMRLTLDSDINKDILQECADKCRRRMPYFFIRKEIVGNEINLVENEAKFIVHNDPLDYIIDESNNDNFLVRLSCNKNVLTFYFFHGLSDAGCMAEYLRMLLVEYYRRLGEDVIPPDDLMDINGEVDPKELVQPMELVPEDIVPAKREKYPFHEIKLKKTDKFYSYVFDVRKEELMEYAKEFDGSPNALASIALAKTIKSFTNKNDKKPICIGVAVNTKHLIGCKESMSLALLSSVFHYDDKALNMEHELLDTCVRGKIIMESSKEDIFSHLAACRTAERIMDLLPTFKARELFCRQALKTVSVTATVSYMGDVEWGSIEKHITCMSTYCNAGAPIVEIDYVNDKFFFTLTSDMDLKDYASKMRRMFIEMGFVCGDLNCQVYKTDPRKIDLPKFGLNKETFMIIKAAKTLAKEAKK